MTHLCHNQQHSFSGLHQPRRLANNKHRFTRVTTNNSPSKDYTNTDDEPTTNIDSPGSKPTTVLATTPTLTIHQLQTLTHLGCNQQQPFSGLHQQGRSISYKYWLTCGTNNNSPHDYTNLDDQPTTNVDSLVSQPTTVLRTTPTQPISKLKTLTHLGHKQQQSSRLHQPWRSTSYKHWRILVATNNSFSQDYTNTDDPLATNI